MARCAFTIAVAAYLVISAAAVVAGVRLLHTMSAASVTSAIGGPAVEASASPPRYLVLMVIDGGRPDYLTITHLPHLQALMAQGTTFTHAFDGILEAETPAGHTTIATGSPPARNGILGFSWTQSDNDAYSLFSEAQMPNVISLLERANDPTIAGLYKKAHPDARVVALSGHKYYAATPLGGPEADAIMYYKGDEKDRYVPVAVPGHEPPPGILSDPSLRSPTTHNPPTTEDTLATKLALATFQKLHQRITLINYPEFDWPLGHVFGGIENRGKVIERMRGFDKDLGMIEDAYHKAGILNQTLFVITSDHGMMPIKRFVPDSIITDAISAAGTSQVNATYNSGAYIWVSDTTKANIVAQNIVNAGNPGIQSVYYLSSAGGVPQYVLAGGQVADAQTRTANSFLLQTLIDGHQPNIVVIGTEGSSFSDPSVGWKGDHGGTSWQSQHIPLVFSGPGIRQGAVSKKPALLEDVAPTLLTDMGVRPVGMQGHVLTDAFQFPTFGDTRNRSREIAHLRPVMQGLLAQESGNTG
ncbi:MAG TPA: alkaline phosphatase family protein [Chloroflexota bacterium]|nr:alkaline phosphatase family protein [Chloroflexota bacterium]